MKDVFFYTGFIVFQAISFLTAFSNFQAYYKKDASG